MYEAENFGTVSEQADFANECFHREREEQRQAARDEEIIQYIEGLKDEPALDSLLAVQDNFGLTSQEIGKYVAIWMERQ